MKRLCDWITDRQFQIVGWLGLVAVAEAKSYGWGSSLPGLKWWVASHAK